MNDLDAIKDRLRQIGVGRPGKPQVRAQNGLAALCEDMVFDDVADLVAEIERLRGKVLDLTVAQENAWINTRLINHASAELHQENQILRMVVEEARAWRVAIIEWIDDEDDAVMAAGESLLRAVATYNESLDRGTT